jgi:hypothetical protein
MWSFFRLALEKKAPAFPIFSLRISNYNLLFFSSFSSFFSPLKGNTFLLSFYMENYLLNFDDYSFQKKSRNYLYTIMDVIQPERGDSFLEDFLEKEVLRMLQLIRSLFKESPLPLQQAALEQGVSVKTLRRMIVSELSLMFPVRFSIKKGQLDYLQMEELPVAELQKKSSLLL